MPLLTALPSLSLFIGFSSPEELVETDVEKCLEVEMRGRDAAEVVVVVIVEVVVLEFWPPLLELAKKRDWEWFEK